MSKELSNFKYITNNSVPINEQNKQLLYTNLMQLKGELYALNKVNSMTYANILNQFDNGISYINGTVMAGSNIIQIYKVNVESLDVREAPDFSLTPIAKLKKDERVITTNPVRGISKGDEYWIHIIGNFVGKSGWVDESGLEKVNVWSEGSGKTVLYTTDSVQIRTAAGSANASIVAVLKNEILLKDFSNSSVQAADSQGNMIDWIKVRYFNNQNANNPSTWTWVEGWVAKDFTDEVSKNIPAKSDLHCSNDYIRQAQMLTNARYIHAKLSAAGWTHNAICGVLGNMETESNINPQFWQREAAVPGYGLVQWTPSSNLIDWANRRGLDPNDIDTQLERIKYEVLTNDDENIDNTPWQKWRHSPEMTFQEFTESTDTPEYLADKFLICYERFSYTPVIERSKQARKWHDILELLP